MDSKRVTVNRTSSSDDNCTSKAKKLKRKEMLEKKKAIDELIKAAYADKDHLTSFAPFCFYDTNGLSVHLVSGCGDKLDTHIKSNMRSLLKANMEGPYGSEWPVEEKVKHREMVVPAAQYIFLHKSPDANGCELSTKLSAEKNVISFSKDRGPLVGFVHYRFTVEEEIPVLYLYELQLESHVQGKGLGKFLMQLLELIALKTSMSAVMLTVQKANVLALKFYTNKLRYTISSISPSRVDPILGLGRNYEILCKTFTPEAKTNLEVPLLDIHNHVRIKIGEVGDRGRMSATRLNKTKWFTEDL